MPKTILVVDDDPAFLSALTPLLSDAGYATITATDGEEALRKLESDSPVIDAVIVDLALPKVGGFSVIGKIARIQKRPLPLVAITGAYHDLYLEVAEYLGARVSLRKPQPGKPLTPIVDALAGLLPA